MLNNNTVQFIFTAVDRVTQVAQGITQSISGMAGKVGGGGIAASFLGNLGATAVFKGLELVSQGYQQVTGSITDAMSAQTSFLSTASALGGSLGVPLDKSKALLESLQKDMSNAAAALPGENKDYLAVLNMVSDTVATAFKGDIVGFKEAVSDITKRTAALGSTVPGLSGEASGQTMEMLMQGNTLQSLKRLDLFQKNAPLKNALEREMQAAGIADKKWTQATLKQRIAVIQKALKATATDDLFNEFSDTAESIIQGMKTKLLDMQTGIFGVMRRVNTRQDRTALDAFTEVLKRIRTLGSAGNRLAKSLGFAIDPMEALIDFFDGLNNFLGNIVYQIDTSTPNLALDSIVAYLGEWVTGLFTKAINGVKSIDSGFLSRAVGLVGQFVANINWVQVGRFLGNTVWKLLLAIIRAIPDVAVLAGRLAQGFVQLVEGLVLGVIEGIGVSLYNLFVKPIIDFFTKIRGWWDRLKSSIPNLGSIGQVASTVANVVTNPVGAAIDLGKKVLGIGGDTKATQPGLPAPGNPTADKVNSVNKVTPVQPSKTVQKVASNTTQSNTIQGLTINASNAGTPQEIASVVIEELNRQLQFKVSQQLA